MEELLEHINIKEKEGILAVSISICSEYFREMKKRLMECSNWPSWEKIVKWYGIPVYEARHLLSGYVINWSDGTSTLVQTVEYNPLLV